jgi:hypothetical protein
MMTSARGSGAAALLTVALIASPAAYAAAENLPAEKPAQAGTDDKSYLPPWMQSQTPAPAPGAPLKDGAPVQTAQSADADSAKKARNPQGQHHRRADWPGGALLRSVADIFGR